MNLTPGPRPDAVTASGRAWPYLLPCVAVWGTYLFAFWPAMLGNDDAGEWIGILHGQFGNSIPAFTLSLLWLITRVSGSPAAVVVTQIVALGPCSHAWFVG